ncbi:MAG: serine/threonine protein kinase [Actinomycetota bacterium]|nr:serine/threonine protein kinase [Actinomycetota bacterium]
MTSYPPGPPGQPAGDHTIAGRYRLLSRLGTGGMGTVWAARDEVLLREVAIKEVTLPPGLSPDQADVLRARTLREARAAARIQSPSAVTVFDVVEEDGRPWIVMERLAARTLADVLREEGPLEPARAAAIGLRVLDALTAAHGAGVLHRDVKPANVLFGPDGRAVLTDFGIAALEGDPAVTTTGMLVGSPGYVAPERLRGENPSPASDLWSLGVTLYAAVAGRSPFERANPMATLAAILEDDPQPPPQAGALAPVIGGLMRKHPAQRMDAATARGLLQAAAAAPGPARTAAVPPVERPATARTQALPLPPAAGVVAGAVPPHAEAPDRDGDSRYAEKPPAAADPRPRRSGAVVAVLAAMALLGGITVAMLVRERDAAPSDPAAAAPTRTADRERATRPRNTTRATTTAPVPAPAPQATRRRPTPTPTPTPTSTPVPEPPTSSPTATVPPEDGPEDTGGEVAEGFTRYESEAFEADLPEGWTVSREEGLRTFVREPGARRFLLIQQAERVAGDPEEDWRNQERSVSQRLPGYRLIGISRADFRDFTAADWQFTWVPRGGPVRVLNRAVVTEDGEQAFALYWSVPVDQWEESRSTFDRVAGSFEPRE